MCIRDNPYTVQPITTRAEYEAYRERFEADQKAKLMEKAGITQEEFQAVSYTHLGCDANYRGVSARAGEQGRRQL